jgi:hypothetical protein
MKDLRLLEMGNCCVRYPYQTRYISGAGAQELHEQVHGTMRKAKDFIRAGVTAAALVAVVLTLAGCGSADKPSAATSSANAKGRKALKSSEVARSGDKGGAGEEDLAEMVAAVSASKAGPPVELKFVLTAKPEVGQVMDVDVAVVPRAPVPDSVSVTFQVAEGLEIVDGSQLEGVEKLVDGTPIRHVVKIRPKRDGIFALTAVVSFTTANQDATRTFSIPVIAGEGLPGQVAKGS